MLLYGKVLLLRDQATVWDSIIVNGTMLLYGTLLLLRDHATVWDSIIIK